MDLVRKKEVAESLAALVVVKARLIAPKVFLPFERPVTRVVVKEQLLRNRVTTAVVRGGSTKSVH
jgi:hypothetical protein